MAERELLVDSDNFIVFAASGLLPRAAEVLGFNLPDLKRLDALPHMLRGSKTYREKYSERTRQLAFEVAEKVSPIIARPKDDDVLQLLISTPGIDEGEALLYGLVAETESCFLTTGDKRSMRSLGLPALAPICRKVSGRIICLETVLKKLIVADGVEVIYAAMQSLVPNHKSLVTILSEANRADQRQCVECLDSVLGSLKAELGADFLFSE
jgi:hypothetical protein